MFVVLLKFAANRDQAGRHMDGHKAWLQRGFDDGVFVLASFSVGGAGQWSLIAASFSLARERLLARIVSSLGGAIRKSGSSVLFK